MKKVKTKGELRKIRKELRNKYGAPCDIYVGDANTESCIAWSTPEGTIETVWNPKAQRDEKHEKFIGEGYLKEESNA